MVFPAKIVDIHDEWDFLTVKVGIYHCFTFKIFKVFFSTSDDLPNFERHHNSRHKNKSHSFKIPIKSKNLLYALFFINAKLVQSVKLSFLSSYFVKISHASSNNSPPISILSITLMQEFHFPIPQLLMSTE